MTSKKDLKFDGGKPKMSLLTEGMPNALIEVVRVLEYGEKKYEAHSWKQKVSDPIPRYKEALLRHANAPEGLLGKDPESGLTHLAQVACNALFLLELLHMEKAGLLFKDLSKEEK